MDMNITHAAARACATLALLALAASSVSAQTPPKTASAAPAHKAAPKAAPAPAAVVEPGSVAAVRKMSAYLRTLDMFSLQVASERDEVDAYGQLLTFNGRVDYAVKRPDGFTIKVAEDRDVRQFFYDGKSLTIFDPKTGFSARLPAPPTIRDTLDLARDKYGITVPLRDLFQWNAGGAEEAKLTSGHFVGPARIADQDAEQYAFRQPGVDWQIWIAKGDKPLPLRIVIVGADDPARPQYEANLAWNTAAQLTADTFVFTPPADAKSIPITPAP
jgi:hypothetical protein